MIVAFEPRVIRGGKRPKRQPTPEPAWLPVMRRLEAVSPAAADTIRRIAEHAIRHFEADDPGA